MRWRRAPEGDGGGPGEVGAGDDHRGATPYGTGVGLSVVIVGGRHRCSVAEVAGPPGVVTTTETAPAQWAGEVAVTGWRS